METRHEQHEAADAPRKGLDDIIREGKSTSLNRAKEALKRRLLQRLMQQVIDEVQDPDEVADEALALLEEDEETLEQAKEALKARLLQQIMEEVIAEIDEEVGSGDGLGADFALDEAVEEDVESEDEDLEEPLDEAASEESERAEASHDAEWAWKEQEAEEVEEEDAEDEWTAEAATEWQDEDAAEEDAEGMPTPPTIEEIEAEEEADAERPDAEPVAEADEADAEWPETEPLEATEEDVAEWPEPDSIIEEEEVEEEEETEWIETDPVTEAEEEAEEPEPVAEADPAVEADQDVILPSDAEATEGGEDFFVFPDAEETPDVRDEDERGEPDAFVGDFDPAMDEEEAYFEDAFRELSEDEEDDFLKRGSKEPSSPVVGGDTVPFEDFEEYDSALSFEDELAAPDEDELASEDVTNGVVDVESDEDVEPSVAADAEEILAEESELDEAATVVWEEAFHEPEPEDADDGLAYYVYGIVPADQDLPDEAYPEGGIVEEHPVFIVQEDDIRALVSRVPAAVYEPVTLQERMEDDVWAETQIRRHEYILEQLMQYAALVPMRFGTVYTSESELREMLRDRLDTFNDTLSRLQGNQEWSLTIRCDVERLRRTVMEDSDNVQELLNDIRNKPRGVAQFIKKKMVMVIHDEVQVAKDECVRGSHDALTKFAEDTKPHPLEGGDPEAEMVHKASYLVRKPDEGDFMGEIERLRGIYGDQGFTYEISGPWPPYSFAHLQAEQPEPLENEGFDV